MRPDCPSCSKESSYISDFRTIRPHGSFVRKSDGQRVRRFWCVLCKKGFSNATLRPAYRQKKRNINHRLKGLLASGVSQRRSARLLKIDRKTVKRKLIFLGLKAKANMLISHALGPKVSSFEFDDLETIENTKLKPVAVSMAVESKSRRILGLRVASMPAKGLLAEKSLKKYGPRKDERKEKRRELFCEIAPLILANAIMKSDLHPHYGRDAKEFFPTCLHLQFEGRKARDSGFGELKKGADDPLRSINHTFAMNRYGISALIRKTWCTAKKLTHLEHHLFIHAEYHNEQLELREKKRKERLARKKRA